MERLNELSRPGGDVKAYGSLVEAAQTMAAVALGVPRSAQPGTRRRNLPAGVPAAPAISRSRRPSSAVPAIAITVALSIRRSRRLTLPAAGRVAGSVLDEAETAGRRTRASVPPPLSVSVGCAIGGSTAVDHGAALARAPGVDRRDASGCSACAKLRKEMG